MKLHKIAALIYTKEGYLPIYALKDTIIFKYGVQINENKAIVGLSIDDLKEKLRAKGYLNFSF